MVKKYIVRLDSEERCQLEQLVKVGKAAAYKRQHAQILLKADIGPGRAGLGRCRDQRSLGCQHPDGGKCAPASGWGGVWKPPCHGSSRPVTGHPGWEAKGKCTWSRWPVH